MEGPAVPGSETEAIWREVLTHGHSHRLAFLPSAPRCFACSVPLGGVGGKVVGLLGTRPSRKNPHMCNLCEDGLPPGGAEVDIAVLFADVRGSTALAERLGPSAFAALLNRFYRMANDVLLANRGIIDKMVGDEVMALYIPSSGPEYRRAAVQAAEKLLRAVGYGGTEQPWLPLGIGVHAGLAYVGKVGTSGVGDFTALGDTVNTAARLQAEAAAGEVLLSEALYESVTGDYPGLEQRVVALRGKEEPMAIRVFRLAALSAQ